jgi:plastocyanin
MFLNLITMKIQHKARFFMFLASVVLLGSTFGCKKTNDNNPGPAGSPGANEVWMQGTQFNPATRIVAVNTTVKWTNKDSFNHTVTSDSTMFSSGNLGGDASYSFQFTKKGTYKYHCSIHTMMKGTIVVQ